MKKKDIYEVTFKIIGIVATYKFIESLLGSAIAFIIFHSISTNINLDFMGGVTQTNLSLYAILIIGLYGLLGYLFLFQTDKILNLLRLTESTEMTLQIEKKAIYHIVVLLIGFFMLTYSAVNLANNTYYHQDEVTTTKQNTLQNTINQDAAGQKNNSIISTSTVTSPLSSTTTSVNYSNIILLLLSILIIIKSVKFSIILMPKEKTELDE